MKNLHYNHMVEELINNPDGLKVRAIARSIYNSEVTLFDIDAANKFKKIHNSVQRFLWSQSRKQKSPFVRKKWGLYALRKGFVYQLELDFADWDDEGLVLEYGNKNKKTLVAEQMADMFAGMY